MNDNSFFLAEYVGQAATAMVPCTWPQATYQMIPAMYAAAGAEQSVAGATFYGTTAFMPQLAMTPMTAHVRT